jgi:hypothetical protein
MLCGIVLRFLFSVSEDHSLPDLVEDDCFNKQNYKSNCQGHEYHYNFADAIDKIEPELLDAKSQSCNEGAAGAIAYVDPKAGIFQCAIKLFLSDDIAVVGALVVGIDNLITLIVSYLLRISGYNEMVVFAKILKTVCNNGNLVVGNLNGKRQSTCGSIFFF